MHFLPTRPHVAARLAQFVLSVVVLLAATSCGALGLGETSGSGTLETRSIDVPAFNSVDVSDTFDVQIAVGGDTSVEVTADDNLLDELDIAVSDGVLSIEVRDGTSVRNATLRATVSMPDLVAASASGASSIEISGGFSQQQDFDVSGASELVADTTAASVNVDASGASTVRLSGTVSTLTIDASGASDIESSLVGVQAAVVNASGASAIDLANALVVAGDLSGASDLFLPPGTEVRVETSGGSSIEQ